MRLQLKCCFTSLSDPSSPSSCLWQCVWCLGVLSSLIHYFKPINEQGTTHMGEQTSIGLNGIAFVVRYPPCSIYPPYHSFFSLRTQMRWVSFGSMKEKGFYTIYFTFLSCYFLCFMSYNCSLYRTSNSVIMIHIYWAGAFLRTIYQLRNLMGEIKLGRKKEEETG